MQLRENSIAAETHGLQSSKQFSIRLNPKAFEILSAQIYKDRILAPIRELICNAYDAAKEDFEVTLPTALNSTFAVRDYGPGLSHEDATTLYTTYFDSTKGHNNDAIGGFGLGSKSPFAYTDQFTVDSFHGGICRSYVCYRDKGIPTISLISETTSNNRTGLRVAFAVRPEDRMVFSEKYNKFACYVPFKIRSNSAVEPIVLHKLTSNISYEPHPFNLIHGYYTQNLILARMGLVCYSIADFDSICKLPFFLKDLFKHKVNIIDFPIGSLSIAPSRETLSYDEPTKQVILKTIMDYRDFVISTAKKEFDAIKTSDPWFDQIKAHIAIRRKFPSVENLGLQIPYQWERTISQDKLNGETKSASYKIQIQFNYGQLTHRLWYLGKFDTNLKINVGKILENLFATFGIKFNCFNYKFTPNTVKINNSSLTYYNDLTHEFFSTNSIYVIKSSKPILKPSSARLVEWAKNNIKGYFEEPIFFNVEDEAKLITWLNDNIFIGEKAKVTYINYDSYTATPVKRESKPAAVFIFNNGTWTDSEIVIQEDKTKQHYYVLSENKYVNISYQIFKILEHLTPDPKTFIAFPKSRYAALKKKADAAGWKHYKDYDFSQVDWKAFSSTHASYSALHPNPDVVRLLAVLKDAGYKFPSEWNKVIERKELILKTDLMDYTVESFKREFNLTISPPSVTITLDDIRKLFNPDWLSIYRNSSRYWTDEQIIQIFKGK